MALQPRNDPSGHSGASRWAVDAADHKASHTPQNMGAGTMAPTMNAARSIDPWPLIAKGNAVQLPSLMPQSPQPGKCLHQEFRASVPPEPLPTPLSQQCPSRLPL
jgi:hypothetical protein